MKGNSNLVQCVIVFLLYLRFAGAVRAAWDEAEEVQPVKEEVEDDCSTWGDTFQEAKQIFLWFDLAWFGLFALMAAGLLLWTPRGLCVDEVSPGEDGLQPIAWYRAAFQSLTSHAAGIVGFVGFNHLVVARVLMLSEPCHFFSLCNCLLYVTLALSVVAVVSSCVFLTVDYLRRLAIDSALQKGFRLTLEKRNLRETGLGTALLVLAAVMLILFVARIAVEAETQQGETEEGSRIYVLLTCVGGCATVSLFYFNLGGLHESPKVQFHTTCFESKKEEKELAVFLKEQQTHGDWLPDWAANFLKSLGGEDLSLLAAHGSRQTFFPQNRSAPLLHVVIGLMILGFFPLGVHVVMERLFGAPKLKDVQELTGDSTELSKRNHSENSTWHSLSMDSMWQFLGLEGNGGHPRHWLLLPASDTGQVQVTPEYRKTLSVKLCCSPGSCHEEQFLNHSLTKFHNTPLNFPLGNASECKLSLLGLSRRSVTEVSLTVVSKDKYHFGSCYSKECKCAEGYDGAWDYSDWNDATWARLNDMPCRRCSNGEEGPPPNCRPAPCDIANSNQFAGRSCSCLDGFNGTISWRGASPVGQCQPAECNIDNANGKGRSCKCADGFAGNITWNGSKPKGECLSAQCKVENSNKEDGRNCRCKDGFEGDITWNGSEPRGSCVAARCRVANSNQESGWGCKCMDYYVGSISWRGSEAIGDCQPAKCIGEKVSGELGRNCTCLEGYRGHPILTGDRLTDSGCKEAPCDIANATGLGPKCRCQDGFEGKIFWKEGKAVGSCRPAPCTVENSDKEPGLKCKCLDYFDGSISWDGPNATGRCLPMLCTGGHVNSQQGPGCACQNGYSGTIQIAPLANVKILKGNCQPARCDIPNSNGEDGPTCKCARGFEGTISWKGSIPQGTCKGVKCDIPDADFDWRNVCACKPGFTGEIVWLAAESRWSGSCQALPCRGDHVTSADGHCSCADGFIGSITEETEWDHEQRAYLPSYLLGECEPVDCTIENSNQKPGTACRCLDGYNGNISWKGSVPQGTCERVECDVPDAHYESENKCKCKPGFRGKIFWDTANSHWYGSCYALPCTGHHVNYVDGPGCRCADGFIGNVSEKWIWHHGHDDWKKVLHGECQPAECWVENSNKAPGPNCSCLDGYSGNISWKGSVAQGSCEPAPCYIDNSIGDGLACRCNDGFKGQISWSGSQPSGKCKRVPCWIPNSDFMPGPGCKCWPQFYGEIKWNGSRVEGECLPKPVCSTDITHITWLQKPQEDSAGHLCEAGQQLVMRGMQGGKRGTLTRIRWTSLQSQPPSRCTWNISDLGESELESMVSRPLPKFCSEPVPIPRCGSEVRYAVTTSKSVPGCEGDKPENAVQLLQFQGRQCGYDLLKWENVSILEPGRNFSNASAQACEILKDGKPLQCGEAPPGEPLPGGCSLSSRAAVFRMFVNPGSHWVVYIKLFDEGSCSIEGPEGAGVFNYCWKTDRTHVHFKAPLSNFVPAFDEMDALFRKQDGNRKASKLVHYSDKFALKAETKPPYWWLAKFREAEENIFNADMVYGCQVVRHINGICYRAMIGKWVDIFNSTEKECSDWSSEERAHEYSYAFTTLATQTYVSNESCLPFASHHELQLDIVDLRSAGGNQSTYREEVGTMKTTCRSYLRFVVNTARCSSNFTFFEAWKQERMALGKDEQLSM